MQASHMKPSTDAKVILQLHNFKQKQSRMKPV